MARAIFAFVAFNVYSLFLIAAFQQNAPHLFDVTLDSEMRVAGEMFNVTEWGSKDHYLWHLFSSVVVTTLSRNTSQATGYK